MNKDADFHTIRNQNYPHAYNIGFDTELGESQWSAESILGNLYAARLGNVITQDKVYRVYLNTIDTNTIWEIIFYDGNNVEIFSVSIDVATYPIMSDLLTELEIRFIAAYGATNWTGIFSGVAIDGTTGYVDFTLSLPPYTGNEWSMVTTNTYDDTLADQNIRYEAIDQSMVGYFQAIGSFDLLGELFVWATTGRNMPVDITISATANNGAGLIRVTAAGHGFTAADNGSSVSISGTGGEADGIWLITYVSATAFDLNGSVFVGAATTGTVTKWHNAYGTVGSVTYNASTEVFTLKKLIRTKELPFRTERQVDALVTKDLEKYNLYWTDNYLNPKALYYYGTFIDDGAIDVLNPETNPGDDGKYSYGTIAEETRLMLNGNRARMRWLSTTQTGGGVKSGNWLGGFQLLTENFNRTFIQPLTNPVNIYSADSGAANNMMIIGDAPGVSTPKRILWEISGLDVGLYKYIELICINLVSPDSYTVWNIKRVEITSETMIIEQSGLESTAFPMNPSEILVESINVDRARHIVSLDNYLLLGDITDYTELDFSGVATQIRHSIKRKGLRMSGAHDNLGPQAEFMDNENVNKFMGLMANDSYRYGIVFNLRNGGGRTQPSPLDDIKIDCLDINTPTSAFSAYGDRRGIKILNMTYAGGGPVTVTVTTNYPHGYIVGDAIKILGDVSVTPIIQINTTHTILTVPDENTLTFDVAGPLAGVYVPDEARISGALESFDLTNNELAADLLTDGLVYSFYVEFHNILWDYVLPNGKKLSEVAESFEIVRQDCIPEVMLTGLFFTAFHYTTVGSIYFPTGDFHNPVASGGTFAVGPPPVSGTYGAPLNDNTRHLAFFLSPDVLLGFNMVNFQTGDQVNLFGYTIPVYAAMPTAGAGPGRNEYVELNGFFQAPLKTTPSILDVVAATNISMGQSGTIDIPGMAGTPINYDTYFLPGVSVETKWDLNMVIGVTQYFQQTLNDSGVYYGQYFRLKANKYGAITDGFYRPTGHYYKPTQSQLIVGVQAVYGGDTFTQKTYHRYSYPMDISTQNNCGLSFYSQNRANTQMRNWDQSDTGPLFPSHSGGGIKGWLERVWGLGRDQFRYNKGYSIANRLNEYKPFDASLTQFSRRPTDIIWSQVKLINSIVDPWRSFLPLDRVSLDRSKGDLIGMHILNGELYTRQQRDFMRQFFNSVGMLKTLESESIILGTGAIMSRPGQTTSTLGSTQKWAFAKGRSQGGKDTLYYISSELGKFIRFGADGTVSIADIKGMRAFFANDIKWSIDDTPAHGSGTHGVWFDRRSEAHFFFSGRRESTEWATLTSYSIGDIVHLAAQPDGTYTTFGKKRELYVCTVNHTSGAATEPETGIDWETRWSKPEHDDPDYYSEFTLVFSEVKNGFICFISPQPKIVMQWANTYFSSLPAFQGNEEYNEDRLYVHNKGAYCEWYKTGPFTGIAMEFTIGSLNVFGTTGGFLASFPRPDKWTYTIPFDGIDFYVESVTDDDNLVLQANYDQSNVAILPTSTGVTESYYISLAEDAVIDLIVNEIPNISKFWEYVQFNTYTYPYRVDMFTERQQTFLDQPELEHMENFFYGQVKADTTNTPLDNTTDAGQPYGPWIRISLKMRRFVYQNLRNLIITVRENLPNPLR